MGRGGRREREKERERERENVGNEGNYKAWKECK
jgi:hypothetical protein